MAHVYHMYTVRDPATSFLCDVIQKNGAWKLYKRTGHVHNFILLKVVSSKKAVQQLGEGFSFGTVGSGSGSVGSGIGSTDGGNAIDGSCSQGEKDTGIVGSKEGEDRGITGNISSGNTTGSSMSPSTSVSASNITSNTSNASNTSNNENQSAFHEERSKAILRCRNPSLEMIGAMLSVINGVTAKAAQRICEEVLVLPQALEGWRTLSKRREERILAQEQLAQRIENASSQSPVFTSSHVCSFISFLNKAIFSALNLLIYGRICGSFFDSTPSCKTKSVAK